LLRDLFNATATLAKALNVDADFSDRVTAAAKKLPPFMITSAGALQEWIEDYEPQVRSLLATLLTGQLTCSSATCLLCDSFFDCAELALTTLSIAAHISPMYPLYPSAQIDPRLNKTTADAAKTYLTYRGDGTFGWYESLIPQMVCVFIKRTSCIQACRVARRYLGSSAGWRACLH